MSLVRLLTAGRSLVGGNHSGLHYRMTNPKAMPKFGSGKNPFRSTAMPEAATEEVPESTPVLPLVVQEPAAEKPVELPALAAPQQPRKVPGMVARWRARVSGWFSRPLPTLPKTVSPRFPKAPVQAELSLDRIQVVRNDLSDADLEIVPARPASKPSRKPEGELVVPPTPVAESGAPGVQSVEKPGRARAAWERANRLLTMTRS